MSVRFFCFKLHPPPRLMGCLHRPRAGFPGGTAKQSKVGAKRGRAERRAGGGHLHGAAFPFRWWRGAATTRQSPSPWWVAQSTR